MNTFRPVFDRSDTILGICEALGQDFGLNPLPLRIALGVSVLWNPLVSLGAYAALGVAVFASRTLFPPRAVVVEPVATDATAAGDNDDNVQPRALAA